MNNSEARFYERAEAWLHRLLELSPVAATELGEHRWDNRLGDMSLGGIESQHREILTAVEEFATLDPTDFGPDAASTTSWSNRSSNRLSGSTRRLRVTGAIPALI